MEWGAISMLIIYRSWFIWKCYKAFSELGIEVQVTVLDITTSDNSNLAFEKQV